MDYFKDLSISEEMLIFARAKINLHLLYLVVYPSVKVNI